MRLQAGGAPRAVQVVLVPQLVLFLGAGRLSGGGDILDGIAQAADEPAHPLGVKRRQDAGGATAPVVASHHGLGDVQRIH